MPPLDPEHRSQQPAEHYDPRTHITAGALRKNRMSVPENIPDRAWIRKSAVRPRTAFAETEGGKAGYLTADFDEPFRVDDPGGHVDGDDWDPISGSRQAAAALAAQGNIILGPKGEPLTRNQQG